MIIDGKIVIDQFHTNGGRTNRLCEHYHDVKTQKHTGLHLGKAREGSKNGSTVPHFSPTLAEVINVCPKSEKIIKEASVKWRKAMEMLADL